MGKGGHELTNPVQVVPQLLSCGLHHVLLGQLRAAGSSPLEQQLLAGGLGLLLALVRGSGTARRALAGCRGMAAALAGVLGRHEGDDEHVVRQLALELLHEMILTRKVRPAERRDGGGHGEGQGRGQGAQACASAPSCLGLHLGLYLRRTILHGILADCKRRARDTAWAVVFPSHDGLQRLGVGRNSIGSPRRGPCTDRFPPDDGTMPMAHAFATALCLFYVWPMPPTGPCVRLPSFLRCTCAYALCFMPRRQGLDQALCSAPLGTALQRLRALARSALTNMAALARVMAPSA